MAVQEALDEVESQSRRYRESRRSRTKTATKAAAKRLADLDRRIAELDRCAALLKQLRDHLARTTEEAFRDLSIMTPDRLVALGRVAWDSWQIALAARAIVSQISALPSTDPGPDHQDTDQGTVATIGQSWASLATDAEKILPHLPSEARRAVRASGFLYERVYSALGRRAKRRSRRNAGTDSGTKKGAEIGAVDIAALQKAMTVRASDMEGVLGADGAKAVFAFAGLTQGIMVAGMDGRISPEVSHELAQTLWQLVRQLGSEDDVEDAYCAAEALEMRLCTEPLMPFEYRSPAERL
jgi:hypothetical protein